MPANSKTPNQESEEYLMSGYKLKAPKQAEAVADAYHKVEDTVVGGYKAVEKKFVDAFLEKAEDEARGGDAPAGRKE